MKPRTLEHLQYFVGKVCSIVATSMNRAFDEKISREHFVVNIQQIDSDGVWGVHPYNPELVSFFSLEHVISIHQEEVIDPTNPEHIKMIKEFEEKTGKKIQSDLNQPVVDLPPEPKKSLLNIIESDPDPLFDASANQAGDSTFVDIESLQRLAEETQRAFTTPSPVNLRKS